MVRIGVFDSGIGGLSVVRELKRMMPGEPVIYFGDTALTPYGSKSRETLRKYTAENIRFLSEKGADIIVVACHSAASAVIDDTPDFSLPLFEVVSPSVIQAGAVSRKGRIGIMGTRATVESRVYHVRLPEIMPHAKVFSQACPLLVPLIEEGWFKARETRMIVKKYLRPLKERQVDTLVLACTHYPLIKRLIQEKAGKRIKVVDPSEAVAHAVSQWIREREGRLKEAPSEPDRYFLSDLSPGTEKIVKYFMGRHISLEKRCC